MNPGPISINEARATVTACRLQLYELMQMSHQTEESCTVLYEVLDELEWVLEVLTPDRPLSAVPDES